MTDRHQVRATRRPLTERRQQIVDFMLMHAAPVTFAQLCEATGLAHSSMVRHMGAMERERIVRRAGLVHTGRAGRCSILWAPTGIELGPGALGGTDGSPVIAWTAQQALRTADLPHRAVSQAAREAARAGR